MIRQALILAAGRGLRLDRPHTPKPLVDVGGQALVVRLIRQLEQAGIERVAVVVGYDGAKVSRALMAYPFEKAEIEIVHNQEWEKGQPGSVLAARDHFSGSFVLAMADHVFDDSIVGDFVNQAYRPGQVLCLVDSRLDQIPAIESAVKVRLADGKVQEIGRKLDGFDAVDAGLFLADGEFFAALAADQSPANKDDLSQGLGRLAKQGVVAAVAMGQGDWNDVDTPADLIHAEMRLRKQLRQASTRHRPAQEPAAASQEFRFEVGAPVVTRMVVGRGFVRDPNRLSLIPPESASSPIFVFTDETVHELYGRSLLEAMRNMGYDVHSIMLPDGEESKSLANYLYLVERVLSRGVDERSVFVSLGGGVVCNVCGFVASTIYRGLNLIHLPTTLMAQCDAAISHKQAINGQKGKNLIGSYYSPRLVAVDVEVLSTLSERLLRDGMAEVLKHALGQDPAYIDLLLSHPGDLRDLDFLERVVRRNVDLKCELAQTDPKEVREAMVLQYGHTVGHAVEHLSGYSFYHGESVAVGMMVAARVARILGGCDDALVDLHETLIKKFQLPTTIPANIHSADIIDALRYSKKHLTEGTRMALLAGPGVLWQVDDDYAIPVSDQVLTEAIAASRERLE